MRRIREGAPLLLVVPSDSLHARDVASRYMQADEPIERVRAAFGDETFERLRTLERRYDPNLVKRLGPAA
jgi:hypothetical protein